MMTWSDTIDALVLRALRAEPRTLMALLQKLPNVYPIDAIEALERLRERGYQATLTSGEYEVDPECLHLPTPHPLDYDWRFTTRTCADLSRRLNVITPTGTILMLGTPSVFLTHHGRQQIHLIDANEAIRPYVGAIDGMPHFLNLLSDPLPEILADVIVADPPWYPEHLSAFLIAASQLVKNGGSVLLSLPGIGTRPTIADELTDLHEIARRAGLRHEETIPNALQYSTPGFEENALRAAGVGVHGGWRHGDLAQFRKMSACEVTREESLREDWIEYAFGSVRIRARASVSQEVGDPRILSLVDGDILPTVSRRDSRRMHALVWTSGNRIFSTRGLGALHVILDALQHEVDPVQAVCLHLHRELDDTEQEIIGEAAAQVRGLVLAETAENQKRQA